MLVLIIVAIAVLYGATPNVKQPKFRWMSMGSAIAVVVFLLASPAFGLYAANVVEAERGRQLRAGIKAEETTSYRPGTPNRATNSRPVRKKTSNVAPNWANSTKTPRIGRPAALRAVVPIPPERSHAGRRIRIGATPREEKLHPSAGGWFSPF